MTDQPVLPLRLLIVDSDAGEAAALEAMLAARGHVTRVARTGCQAWELAATLVPDAAFIALDLPTMSGFELARRLRTMPRWLGISLIALSSAGRDEDEPRALRAGFDHRLARPLSLERLEEALALLVRRAIRPRVHRAPPRIPLPLRRVSASRRSS